MRKTYAGLLTLILVSCGAYTKFLDDYPRYRKSEPPHEDPAETEVSADLPFETKELDPPSGYESDCTRTIGDEVEAQVEFSSKITAAARQVSIAAEQERLGVKPLLITTILGANMGNWESIKPEVDPYPESIVVIGNIGQDVRTTGYETNHGIIGKSNVYETAPGSHKYFIVDRIGGDGLGANSMSMPGMNDFSLNLSAENSISLGSSWHNWHASASNELVRAAQEPAIEIVEEIKVCGCGAMQELEKWSEPIASQDSPSLSLAIFMLPGRNLPTFMSDKFVAKFGAPQVNVHYIPKRGFQCVKEEVAC
jgi:hypothetical protein